MSMIQTETAHRPDGRDVVPFRIEEPAKERSVASTSTAPLLAPEVAPWAADRQSTVQGVDEQPAKPTRTPNPRKRAARATAPETTPVAAPSEPMHEKHHRPKTGAGARLNADHIALYRLVVAGVIVTALAAVAISWQGLTAVGSWFLPPAFAWLLPVAIDVAIVVFTLATLSRRSRGETVALLLVGAYGLTAVSAAANAMHVFLEPVDGLGKLQTIIAAVLAGLAPMLILLTTEVLGTLITKPPRAETPSKKLKAAEDEMKALKRELARVKKLVPKDADQ